LPAMAGSGGDRVGALEAENAELRAENAVLASQARALEELVEQLRSKVADLEAQLGRNSQNSSKPPSSDTNTQRGQRKASRAERRAEARKVGKQPGAEGRHLARVENPDRTVVHRPEACAGCGAGLGGDEVVGAESRQVFDLPPIRPEVTDHIAHRVRCRCGHNTTAAFPPEATAPACWGPGVRALGLYLTARQHLPVARAAELLSDVLGAPVSTGFVAGLQPEAANRLGPFLERLRALLAGAVVLHADETSARVSGGSQWFHVVCTPLFTLFVCHPKRGRDAISDIAVLPGYRGVIMHDGLAAYDYLDGAAHAQCCAHLLRHLAGVGEVHDQKSWTDDMASVLLDAKAAAETARDVGAAKVGAWTAADLRRRYRQSLEAAFSALPPGPPPRRRNRGGWWGYQRDAWNLAVRFRDNEADILRFLTDARLPFDNNEAERALRMVKLQQKISGTFRSPEGARAFAACRSYIQTAAKNGQNLLEVLRRLFTTGPWLPALPGP